MSKEMRTGIMELGKVVVVAVGLFILGIAFGLDVSKALFVMCVPYGWGALNKVTPNLFIWMPFIGWVIYFILKLTLAAVVGVFVLAYKVVKCAVKIVLAYSSKKTI